MSRKGLFEAMRAKLSQRHRKLYLLWVSLLVFCPTALQPQDRPVPPLNSELDRENLSRVAASAADIKALLVKDAGLMVEVRRCLAKQATGHGQIISESDLTEDAIFDRLEKDVQFRSLATTLLQEYGYLVPVINPNSQAAKEQDFLFQQRTKLIAANQENELAVRRLNMQKSLRPPAAVCDTQLDADCSAGKLPQQQSPASQQQRRSDPVVPFESVPPSTAPENRTDHLELTQTEEEAAGTFPALTLAAGYESILSPNPGTDSVDERSSDSHLVHDDQASVADSDKRNQVEGLTEYEAETASANLATPRPGVRERGLTEIASRVSPSRRSPPPPPDLVRASSPYREIPSLYDMYIQAVPRPAAPKRFGAEVFENGSRDPQLIPMDLPAGPDYVVGPGDALSIDLWGGVTQRIYRLVDREGRVSLPEIGPMLVSGKSLSQVQADLQQTLRMQFRNVSADVSLARLRTIRIYEVGDIQSPGAYDVSSLSTPLNALFAAGGPTPKGSLRSVRHLRGNQLIEVVDLYDLLLHGVKSDLRRLENGDTVLVPPIGPEVTVEGMVRRPAIYELKGEKNLAAVLELAGGLLPTATLRHIEVQRLP